MPVDNVCPKWCAINLIPLEALSGKGLGGVLFVGYVLDQRVHGKPELE